MEIEIPGSNQAPGSNGKEMEIDMGSQKVRIIRKKDDFSLEYQTGDILTVDSAWYGGVNVTGRSGIPLSLDVEEYEPYQEEGGPCRQIDSYSYALGVMDCFCEMVAAGLKRLAMSHPMDTREERDACLEDVKGLCRKYGVKYYPEDEPFITDLFPEELNKGKYNYLFYREDGTLECYMKLKNRQRALITGGIYKGEERLKLAGEFGRLLSYPEDGIERLIEKTSKK